jgi:hypothetical protein
MRRLSAGDLPNSRAAYGWHWRAVLARVVAIVVLITAVMPAPHLGATSAAKSVDVVASLVSRSEAPGPIRTTGPSLVQHGAQCPGHPAVCQDPDTSILPRAVHKVYYAVVERALSSVTPALPEKPPRT